MGRNHYHPQLHEVPKIEPLSLQRTQQPKQVIRSPLKL